MNRVSITLSTVASLLLSISASEATPVLNAGNGNGYEFISGVISYSSALADATARGDHVATITTASELGFVQSYMQTVASPNPPFLNVWLGGSDEAQEGVWRWIVGPEAGQPIPFGPPFWFSGNPNNGAGAGDNEDHLQLLLSGCIFLFNDVGSGDPHNSGYLLEIENFAETQNPDPDPDPDPEPDPDPIPTLNEGGATTVFALASLWLFFVRRRYWTSTRVTSFSA